jgi:hypothetical protein
LRSGCGVAIIRHRRLVTSMVGFVTSLLGCLTPILVVLLAANGVSASMGWLDYALLLAIETFTGPKIDTAES